MGTGEGKKTLDVDAPAVARGKGQETGPSVEILLSLASLVTTATSVGSYSPGGGQVGAPRWRSGCRAVAAGLTSWEARDEEPGETRFVFIIKFWSLHFK